MQVATMVHGNVLLTGGNRGIGLNLVKQLASIPDVETVFATCRSPKSATELQELAKENNKVHVVQLDVSNAESIKNAAKVVEEKLAGKGLNMLINNAAIMLTAPRFEEVTAEQFMETYAVNSVSPVLIMQTFMPFLEKAAEIKPANETDARNAIIVNISSIGGSLTTAPKTHKLGLSAGFGNILPYFCSKAALNMITRCVAVEKPNVTVVSLHPGWVNTDMGGSSGELTSDQSASAILKTLQNLKNEQTGCFLNWEGQPMPW